MAEVNLLVGLPSHHGGCLAARQLTLAQKRHPDWNISFRESQFSILTWAFNDCWAFMLNHRNAAQFTHFLLLHDDIRPVHDDWLGVLVSEMARVKADVLSVVVPLKCEGDFTSTALDNDDWSPKTLRACSVEQRAETFKEPDLLVNTGLMLVKVGDWCELACFTIRDRIVRKHGQWVAEVQPEDWNFSRWCHRQGLQVYATRAIGVEHVGTKAWRRG